MTNVLEEAIKVFGSESAAEYWYYNKTLKQFGGLSPHEIVVQGGEDIVLELLSQIDEEVG